MFIYTADANLFFHSYKLLNVTIFKHIWRLSLPCACFFIVFGWHLWSSCTLKVKKSLCVAQFTSSHCCPCTMWYKSLWPGCSVATLCLFLKAELVLALHNWLGRFVPLLMILVLLLLKPVQVWSWEFRSQGGVLCEWAQQTPWMDLGKTQCHFWPLS